MEIFGYLGLGLVFGKYPKPNVWIEPKFNIWQSWQRFSLNHLYPIEQVRNKSRKKGETYIEGQLIFKAQIVVVVGGGWLDTIGRLIAIAWNLKGRWNEGTKPPHANHSQKGQTGQRVNAALRVLRVLEREDPETPPVVDIGRRDHEDDQFGSGPLGKEGWPRGHLWQVFAREAFMYLLDLEALDQENEDVGDEERNYGIEVFVWLQVQVLDVPDDAPDEDVQVVDGECENGVECEVLRVVAEWPHSFVSVFGVGCTCWWLPGWVGAGSCRLSSWGCG